MATNENYVQIEELERYNQEQLKIEELDMYVEVDVRKTLPDTPTPVGAVTGVKGSAETQYRTGNVNISPENIGLGNVDNTSDLNKPISTAEQGEIDRIDGKIDHIGEELRTLDEKIEAETTARQQAINAEAQARATAITNEQQAREDEDTTINANIQTLSDGLQEAEQGIQELQNDIDQLEQSITAEENRAKGVEEDLSEAIEDLQQLIPSEATAQNKLADKAFVNSTVSTNTANYIYKTNAQGEHLPFDSLAELEAYSGTLTNNDYAFVVTRNGEQVITAYNRYKYNANNRQWAYEYTLNNSSFTAAQWAAINSGISETLVAQITTNTQAISDLITSIATKVSDVKNGDGTSLVNAQTKIATIPDASASTKGLAKVGAGLKATNGQISTDGATASEIATGTNGDKPLTPATEMIATKKSLGVAVGSSTSNTSWTEAEKTTARGTLGAIADSDIPVKSVSADNDTITPDANKKWNIPRASQQLAGVIRPYSTEFFWSGLYFFINGSTATHISGRENRGAIKPSNLNSALIAGLTDANHITLTETQKTTAREVFGAGTPANIIETTGTMQTSTLPAYTVPLLTKAQIQTIQTDIAAGKTVMVKDSAGQYVVNESDSTNHEIRFTYLSLYLGYYLEGDNVVAVYDVIGGGGEPDQYVKSASVNGNTLTLTKKDNTTVVYTPTIGNGTITINQGGVQKGTFTVNQNGNTTIDLDAGGGGAQYEHKFFIEYYGGRPTFRFEVVNSTDSEITSLLDLGAGDYPLSYLDPDGQGTTITEPVLHVTSSTATITYKDNGYSSTLTPLLTKSSVINDGGGTWVDDFSETGGGTKYYSHHLYIDAFNEGAMFVYTVNFISSDATPITASNIATKIPIGNPIMVSGDAYNPGNDHMPLISITNQPDVGQTVPTKFRFDYYFYDGSRWEPSEEYEEYSTLTQGTITDEVTEL